MPNPQGDLFAPGSHTSYQAAVSVRATRPTKTRAYLRFLARRGPSTDHEARAALQWPLSSICSIRNTAMRCGLVTKGFTTRPSPYDKPCATWCLTREGQAVVAAARAMAEAE